MDSLKEQVPDTAALIERARAGDQDALAALFETYRDRLRRMVDLRLDQRLAGRVDPSDILQEAFIDLAQKLNDFARKGDMPFFLWLRLVTGERLLQVHRRHLATGMRDVRKELPVARHGVPNASSLLLAGQLIGSLTSAAERVIKEESKARVHKTLEGMEDLDREVIALRHFEELSNLEVAQVLGLSPTAASNRYIRAIKRLKDCLSDGA